VQISNVGLSAGQYSTYGFTTTLENLVTAITETSDAAADYPAVGTQTASDLRLDAENRLVESPILVNPARRQALPMTHLAGASPSSALRLEVARP
jgi:hypothetical protein